MAIGIAARLEAFSQGLHPASHTTIKRMWLIIPPNDMSFVKYFLNYKQLTSVQWIIGFSEYTPGCILNFCS